MSRTLIFSALEQGLTSIVSLALGLGLIMTAGPVVFGQFTFIFSVVLISASLQYGLVGLPILVEFSSLKREEQTDAETILLSIDQYLRGTATVAAAISGYVLTRDVAVALAAAAFAYTYLWRETSRNIFFGLSQPLNALKVAVVSAACILALLFVLLRTFPDSPLAALIAAAVGNFIAQVFIGRQRNIVPAAPATAFKAYRKRFPLTGWTLSNSIANELQTRAHVFFIQIARGSGALGNLEAARILFAPLFLASSVWQRAMQPRLAAQVADGNLAGARRITLLGMGAIGAMCVVYALAIYVLYDLIAARLFADRFGDLSLFAVGWAAYACLLLMCWTLTSYLNALRAFRAVALVGFAAAFSTIVLLPLLFWNVPLLTALVILNFVQGMKLAVLLAMIWKLAPAAPDPV